MSFASLKNASFSRLLIQRHLIKHVNESVRVPVLYKQTQCRAYFRSSDFLRKARDYDISPSLFSSSFSSCSSNSTTSLSKVRFVGWYLGMINSRPILTKSVTSGLIYTAADLSSQVRKPPVCFWIVHYCAVVLDLEKAKFGRWKRGNALVETSPFSVGSHCCCSIYLDEKGLWWSYSLSLFDYLFSDYMFDLWMASFPCQAYGISNNDLSTVESLLVSRMRLNWVVSHNHYYWQGMILATVKNILIVARARWCVEWKRIDMQQ